jgi:hypothetical protein
MSHQPPPPVSGAQFQGPPQGYYPPQPAPKKRKKWPWVVGGLAVVMLAGCAGAFALVGAGAKSVSDGLNEMDGNQKGQNAVAAEMNKPAKDGKFEFTVSKMKCGVDSVGGQFGEKAQGEFCLVSVSVTNVADTAETFNDSSQQAIDGKGKTYDVDSAAGTYANKDSSTFLESINPGNTVKGDLVFDVPEGTKLSAVVLHESMFTAGIKVPLS